MLMEGAVTAWSADSLDQSRLQALDGDGSVLCEAEIHHGVLLVEALEKLDLFPLGLRDGVFWEVAVAEERGYITAFCQSQPRQPDGGDLLVHLGQSLTPNPLATLPVRLILGKVKGPPSKCSLLQDPAPAVKVAVVDVTAKIIDSFAHIE